MALQVVAYGVHLGVERGEDVVRQVENVWLGKTRKNTVKDSGQRRLLIQL